MIRTPLIALCLVLAFTACNSDSDADADEVNNTSTLQENLRLWQSQGITDYQITIRKSCFCLYIGTIVVVVRDSEITEAFFADSGEFLTPSEMQDARTIEDYFALAEHAINNADSYAIEYDPDYGFPVEIHADYLEDAVDDEISYYILDFQ